MQKLTIREYAVKHKLSIFNTIKLTKTGKLATESVTEEGKEVVYILPDKSKEDQAQKENFQVKQPKSLEEENSMLKNEIKRLKMELEKCKKRR